MTDRNAFERWLVANHWFQDAFVDSISPVPGPVAQLAVCFELRYQVDGGLVAGQKRTMRRIQLRCSGLRRFEFEWGEFSEGNCIEGIETLDGASSPIAFAIEVPGRLIVEAIRAEVVELPDLVEVVPAWESEDEAHVTLADELPTPLAIIERAMERTGVPLVWRMHGGEARSPADVPTLFDGWFLQRADRVLQTDGGIMLLVGKSAEGFHTLLLRTMSDELAPVLWSSVLCVFASFGVARARCGNRELDAISFRDMAARKMREAGLAHPFREPEPVPLNLQE